MKDLKTFLRKNMILLPMYNLLNRFQRTKEKEEVDSSNPQSVGSINPKCGLCKGNAGS